VLARKVFQFDLDPALWLFPAATLGGMALSLGVGWLAVRRLTATPPMLALRAGA
jgi:hypothetical protein